MMQFIETLNANLWLKLLIDTTLKSLVIFAIAGLFGFMHRRQSAAVRGLVWGMAIVGCLIVPLFSLTLPQWQVGVRPATPVGFEADLLIENRPPSVTPVPLTPRPSSSTAASSTQATPTPTPFQPPPATSERGILAALHWTDWMVVGWALVALFLLARLIVGIGAVWYISARSDDFSGAIAPLRLDLKRRYRVRLSDAVTVPMVWGFFRPVILLPADANNWQAERQRAVLLHELGHIQRRDWLMQTIAQLTCALYWFNPLVWFATRQMRTEAEQACDDHVLNAGYQSTDYAQHLLDIVRNVKAAGSAARAAVAMARQSKIEERLRTVLAENRNRHPVTKVAVAIGLLVLTCFAIPMGAMRLAEAVDEEDTLYQEIQNQQKWERVVQLCDQFLKAYPQSERYDEVWYEKLSYLSTLKRDTEFDAGVEAFLSERPSSKYADKLHILRAYHLERQFKFHEALAEWDKVEDPALLPEVYDRKGQIHSRMNNWAKRREFDLLRAELILGKPAPEFSHTSVDGVPVSLDALRGKVVVLYHWSTRDGRTVSDDETGGEISALKRLYETHSENPNFVLIAVCTQSSEAVLKEFVETHAMPGIHLLLEHEAVPYQFGVGGWPYYVVLDKAGILRESGHSFALEDFAVEQLVTALLAEDIDVPGERVIPRIIQLRAEVYDGPDRDQKVIAAYEKLLAFTPSNLNLMMQILSLKPEQTDETETLMNLSAEIHQQVVGTPTIRHVTVAELEISDDGKVTTLKAAHPGRPGEILRGDALVTYDGRLLAVSLENKVRYDNWGPSSKPLPIDQIRAALERMNIIDLMESRIEKPAKAFELVLEAENFTRLDGVKPKVPPFLTMDDETASGGAYIVANTALDNQYEETETWLTYEIEIPADGDYALWLYGRAFTGKSDSFFVSTDLETRRACDMSSYDKWGAVPAIDRVAPQATPAFYFTKGKHEIRLFVRETGTELDAIFLTNDLSLQADNVAKQFQSSGKRQTR